MKILITGGAGFIGSNLASFHLKKADNVTVIDSFITGSERNLKHILHHKDFHLVRADVTSCSFEKLPSFDIIYHLASPASPIQYKKYPIETLMVNSLGTKRLLDFMLKTKSKRFVFSSTSETYGDPLIHPQKEDYWGNVNPVGIRSCYDESKRFGEALCMSYVRKHNLDIRIARIFNTFGPYMEQNDGRVVSNFIIQALQKKPFTIYGDGTQTRSFCYVTDMVQGLYLLATTNKLNGEIVNLGNTDERTVKELALLIKKLTNTSSSIIRQNIDTDDPQRRKPDINKAKQLLGWKPTVTLEKGLVKTIAYFQELI